MGSILGYSFSLIFSYYLVEFSIYFFYTIVNAELNKEGNTKSNIMFINTDFLFFYYFFYYIFYFIVYLDYEMHVFYCLQKCYDCYWEKI